MSYDTFYSLRLSEVIDFIEVNNKKTQNTNDLNCIYFGSVCATVANFSQGKKRKKYTYKDFFKVKENKSKNDKAGIEEQTNYLLMLTMALGGSVEGW
jgi:hypothetical protein